MRGCTARKKKLHHDLATIQVKLAYVTDLDLIALSTRSPFVLSRLHSVPALSSSGQLLFPNLRSLYIENFVQPLTLHGWEQRTEPSFLAGVTSLEVAVAGKRAVVPPQLEEEEEEGHAQDAESRARQEGLKWLFSLHPYGLTNLKDVCMHLDYEWLQKASIEMLLGRQPALEYITIDMSTSIARDRQRRRCEDNYWAYYPIPRSDLPTHEYRQQMYKERKERLLDTLMTAVERLHLTYPRLDKKGGIRLDVAGDRAGELGHMLIDRVRRQAVVNGYTPYSLPSDDN